MKKLTKIKVLFILLFFIFIAFSCKEDSAISPKTEQRVEGSLLVDGIQRTYLLNLPPNYDEATDFALVIAMHGAGGKATQMESDYLLTEKANSSKFVIVYPERVQSSGILGVRTWNAGTCCDYAVEKQIDDVKYISLLIDELLKKYPKINPKKVYATGMSNGGMMSYRLACELSHKIAAIAPVACSMVTVKPCNPSRAVPILHIHSKLDEKVPYQGGIGIFGYYFPPVEAGIDTWLRNNQCPAQSKKINVFAQYTHIIWENCLANSTIEVYLTEDGGHSWAGGLHSRVSADVPSKAISANDLIWAFFQKYQLP
ncbi:alpha/beta hydrolase family esterase [Thermoflexibacter ruber]|uniref:Polyhydroxybutyrate depolymerase n=1 Tax=Thermoflexibacter ruber TaxID=1003 RepID=A0A1I2ISM3_9BACT|nr:PHB depolymerase family esterase [Thermoflexibacter ruber]SFF44633.1 polyhydroxybutyrate depolymerase [Thermoflexibacter ruber]